MMDENERLYKLLTELTAEMTLMQRKIDGDSGTGSTKKPNTRAKSGASATSGGKGKPKKV
jgi:hypothetical protein